jgi:hypothetical protein
MTRKNLQIKFFKGEALAHLGDPYICLKSVMRFTMLPGSSSSLDILTTLLAAGKENSEIFALKII